MANSKITNLGALTAAAGDEIPVNRAGADGKITVGDITALGATKALDNLASVAINTALLPASNDSCAIGASGTAFADLFLASGGVINFNAGAATITESSNDLNLAATDDMNFSAGGSQRWSLDGDGHLLALQDNAYDIGASGGTRPRSLYLGTSLFLPSGGVIDFNAGDVTIRRSAAANLALGAVDAAAPVAQTLSVQNVAAGTSDTAGAAFTISGSQGTGTGAGGTIIFQTANAAGGSGSSQNALAAKLTIGTNRSILLGGASASGYTITVGSGGFETLYIAGNADGGGGNSVVALGGTGGEGVTIRSGAAFSWNSGSSAVHSGIDTMLSRAAAATIRLGGADAASPVAQTLSVQNVVAGTSNTAGADFTISASRSTGNVDGGRIVLKASPAGSSGSSQNTLVNVAAVMGNGHLRLNSAGFDVAQNIDALATNNLNAIFSNALYMSSGFQLWWASSSTNPTSGNDLYVRRAGAANLGLGLTDAASPVAQTLSVQNVVAGTSDTAGADWTFQGSKGTGTGAGGSIILKTAAAAGSGSSQNSATTALTIAGSGKATWGKAMVEAVVVLSDGATPALDASQGNIFTLDAAGDRTIAVPSNATSGQKIVIRHYANTSARTLALNSGAGGFRFATGAALTATTAGKYDYIGCIYNAVDSKWDVVSYTKDF